MNNAVFRQTNILVMHSDPLVCAGLVAALRQQGDFNVFVDGTDPSATDGRGIDVIIADYADAVQIADATARVPRQSLATARVLVLTANDREADVRRAVEAGVHGYLLLGCSLGELIEGITTVAYGMRYLCRSVAQRMADSLTREALTSREIEVLQLLMTGESNKAIARQLHIEVGTVKSHVSSIMTKLGAVTRTQAAGIAANRGLVEERSSIRQIPSVTRVNFVGAPAHA